MAINRKIVGYSLGAAVLSALGYKAGRAIIESRTQKNSAARESAPAKKDRGIATVECPTCGKPVREYEFYCPFCGGGMKQDRE